MLDGFDDVVENVDIQRISVKTIYHVGKVELGPKIENSPEESPILHAQW